MDTSCLLKQRQIKEIFETLTTPEERYNKIIELGRALPKITNFVKNPENLVKGCQSIMYLYSTYKDGKVFFEVESDALISSGLAALLLKVYSGESPEAIIKCPPKFLEELGITASLTPNRANGLYSLHLKMKQDALKYLIQK